MNQTDTRTFDKRDNFSDLLSPERMDNNENEPESIQKPWKCCNENKLNGSHRLSCFTKINEPSALSQLKITNGHQPFSILSSNVRNLPSNICQNYVFSKGKTDIPPLSTASNTNNLIHGNLLNNTNQNSNQTSTSQQNQQQQSNGCLGASPIVIQHLINAAIAKQQQQQQQQQHQQEQQKQMLQAALIKLLLTTQNDTGTLLIKALVEILEGNHQSQKSHSDTNVSRYKTELCRSFEEIGECKYGKKCQFAHGAHELRNFERHPKYKTELCRSYHNTGFCPYGLRCHFVHNIEEARTTLTAPTSTGTTASTATITKTVAASINSNFIASPFTKNFSNLIASNSQVLQRVSNTPNFSILTSSTTSITTPSNTTTATTTTTPSTPSSLPPTNTVTDSCQLSTDNKSISSDPENSACNLSLIPIEFKGSATSSQLPMITTNGSISAILKN